MFMNYFYLTFDMSPYDEFGDDYITIGVAPINPYNIIGQDKYIGNDTGGGDDQSNTTNGTIPVPIPPEPTPPTPTPPTPPTPDQNSSTDTNGTVPVKPDSGGGAIVTPGGDPNEDSAAGWFATNKVWVIGLGILLLLILIAVIYLCTRKSEKDPYFAKHYSVVSEGPLFAPKAKKPKVQRQETSSPLRNSGVIN